MRKKTKGKKGGGKKKLHTKWRAVGEFVLFAPNHGTCQAIIQFTYEHHDQQKHIHMLT
jgi:hypothetical protein